MSDRETFRVGLELASAIEGQSDDKPFAGWPARLAELERESELRHALRKRAERLELVRSFVAFAFLLVVYAAVASFVLFAVYMVARP